MSEKLEDLDPVFASGTKKKVDTSELEALDPVFSRPLPTFGQNRSIGPAQPSLPEGYQMARRTLFGEGEIPKGYGELAGLGVGAASGVAEQGANILRAMRQSAQSPTGSAYEKWLRNFAGMERTGPGGVPEAAQTYQRSKTHGEAGKKMFQRYGTQPLDISRYLEGVDEAERTRRLSALEQMAQKTSKGLGHVPGLSLLAGTVGGGDVVEAMRRLEKGDYPGAAIKGLGGLGALASLIPTVPTRIGGGALSLLSLPLEAIYSGMKGPTESAEYQAP